MGWDSLTGGMAKFNDTNWVIYNTSNSGLSSNEIRYIRLDSFNNKWICTDFGGLCKFNSWSNNWTVYNTTNSGIPSNFITTINISPNNLKEIAPQNQGLAIYDDTNWQIFNTFNSPLPNNTITRMGFDKFCNLWIGTLNGLAIYNPNGIIGINNQGFQIPKKFALHQNFPNPFNPTTNIEFELQNTANISLIVYNIEGKLIGKLLEGKYISGKYIVEFNGNNLSSGIYFYQLKANNFIETRKMILIK